MINKMQVVASSCKRREARAPSIFGWLGRANPQLMWPKASDAQL